MLLQQQRLKREFIYRRSIEAKEAEKAEKKSNLLAHLDSANRIPSALDKKSIVQFAQNELDWDDAGGEKINAHDDEYAQAGVQEPRLLITTSHDPSSSLKQFAKELRHLFPNAERLNRGAKGLPELVEIARLQAFSDLIIVQENRGVPAALVICHLPFGPTARFTLLNVLKRHDMDLTGVADLKDPDAKPRPPHSHTHSHTRTDSNGDDTTASLRKMPTQYPHLLFRGLNSPGLGLRVRSILTHLFPPPKPDSTRVIVFADEQLNDVISFRNYTFQMKKTRDENTKRTLKKVELEEHGPRFQMTLYNIIRGLLTEEATADVEYVFRPFMNTARKRKLLSVEEETAEGGSGATILGDDNLEDDEAEKQKNKQGDANQGKSGKKKSSLTGPQKNKKFKKKK